MPALKMNGTILNEMTRNSSGGSVVTRELTTVETVFVVFMSIEDVLNIIGNILIVILIYKENQVKTTVSKLFVNQAFADGCVGILLLGFTVYDQHGSDNVGYTSFRVCVATFYSESLQTLGATVFSMYMAICHPLRFKVYNQACTVAVFIVASWSVNFVVAGLVFAADDDVVNMDLMMFSFYRFRTFNVWYEVVKMVAMFSPALLTVVCFGKICIYQRAIKQGQIEAQSETKRLVRQSVGVLFLHSVYTLAFLVQILYENISPVTQKSDRTSIPFVIASIVYLYLVFKLPLFLVAFKPYRKVALGTCCPTAAVVKFYPLPPKSISSDGSCHRSKPGDDNRDTPGPSYQ